MRKLLALALMAGLAWPATAQDAPAAPVAAAPAAAAPAAAAPAAAHDATPAAASAAAPKAAAVNDEGAKGQKMICRTSRETGSLAKSKKRCYTAEQWALIENKHREAAGQIQNRNAGIYNPP